MTYKVGVGILLDNPHFNSIRAIEMQIYDSVSNSDGLNQPPHVTIKRPFELKNIKELGLYADKVCEIVEKTASFDIKLQDISNFSHKTIYLNASTKNKELTILHNRLISAAEALSKQPSDSFEGSNMLFHTTLAMNLNELQYSSLEELIYTLQKFEITIKAEKVGLFMAIDNDKHWVVLKEFALDTNH